MVAQLREHPKLSRNFSLQARPDERSSTIQRRQHPPDGWG